VDTAVEKLFHQPARFLNRNPIFLPRSILFLHWALTPFSTNSQDLLFLLDYFCINKYIGIEIVKNSDQRSDFLPKEKAMGASAPKVLLVIHPQPLAGAFRLFPVISRTQDFDETEGLGRGIMTPSQIRIFPFSPKERPS
jgi:hypothetical protein